MGVRIQIVTWESSLISDRRPCRARQGAQARRGVVALLVVAALLVSRLGQAAPDPKKEPNRNPKTAAKRMLLEGAELVKRGDYEAALVRFKAAYDLVPNPKIQYNLGIAYMGLERNAEAFEAFQTFLGDASEASTETITKARLYKESLLLKVCRLTIRSDVPGAMITLDGRPRGATPRVGELLINAGTHSLVVAKDGVGKTFTKWFDATAGSTLAIEANLLPPQAAPPPPVALTVAKDPDLGASVVARPASSPRRWVKRAGYATGALAVAALGFGTVEWVIKELRFRDFNNLHCGKLLDNLGGDGCTSLYNEGTSAKKLGYVGFAAAGVLGAASTIFFVVSHPRAAPPEESSRSFACAPSLTMPGAACRLTF